jgi:hypothetical protein
MDDERLGALLRELPGERATSGFTARVLARLNAEKTAGDAGETPARPLWLRPAVLLAAAAVLALAAIPLGIYSGRPSAPDRDEAARLLRELRAEHRRLERDLQALPTTPVLYLGGDENVELVIDVSRVPYSGPQPEPAAHQPDTF